MRLTIVEDHPIVRLGLRALVAAAWPDWEVEEARSLAEGLALQQAGPADLALLDLGLPDAGGLEGPARWLQALPGMPVVVVSVHAEPEFAAYLFRLGVGGFVSKEQAGEELVEAIERVRRGKRFLTAGLVEAVLALVSRGADAGLPHERLSGQERRVMALMAAGRSPAQIAQALQLSAKSVASYRARVLAKGGWADDVALMRYAARHGLGPPL